MAPDVISLLSSPEPDFPNPNPPRMTSKTLGAFGKILAQPESAALYAAVDRIPESSNHCPSAQPRKDEWWISSDDFDTTGDLRGGNHPSRDLFADDRATKRRRLTPSPSGSPASSSVNRLVGSRKDASPRLHATRSPPGATRPRTGADIIELLSSPPGSPIAHQRGTAATTTANDPSFLDAGAVSDSSISNPFLSSPPLLRKPKEPEISKARKGKGTEIVLAGSISRISPRKAAAWDPISSSAPASSGVRSSPPSRPLQRSMTNVVALDDSDLDVGPDPATDNEFPDDLAKLKTMKRPATGKASMARSKATATKSAATTTTVGTKKTAEERETERAQKKAEKELAKEQTKRQKEAEKARRAQEKEQAAALAEVNKIRTDKKVSTPEMLVDLPESLPETTRLQAELLLHDLQVDFHPWTSPVENVVKWRRKVRSKYNPSLGHWEPVPMFVQDEEHAMVILTARQFVDLVVANQPGSSDSAVTTSEPSKSLASHITRLKQHFPKHTLIYLIEGLTAWMRKNRTVRDRQFQAAVRSGIPPAQQPQAPEDFTPTPTTITSSRRRKAAPKPPAIYIDEDLVEDALLSLQITHSTLIHHTTTPLETSRQIAIFTQHLSTLPYRRVKDQSNLSAAGFCMESGQVRSGDGARDTYVRMLQEITRVTAPIAYGIVGEFASVAQLVRGLESGGPLRLEDVRRCADRMGTAGDRRVGQAVSKRVWKVFTGRDEASMDV